MAWREDFCSENTLGRMIEKVLDRGMPQPSRDQKRKIPMSNGEHASYTFGIGIKRATWITFRLIPSFIKRFAIDGGASLRHLTIEGNHRSI